MRTNVGLMESGMNQEQTQFARWFYTGIGLLLIAICMAGFLPSMIALETRSAPLPLTPMVTMHAVAAVGFLLLYVVQTLFIQKGQVGLHRVAGMIGAALALIFVVTGWFVLVEQAHRGYDLSGSLVPRGTTAEPPVLLNAVFAFLAFGICVLLAILYRDRPNVHKRFMVLSLIGGLSGAPILHILGFTAILPPALNVPVFTFINLGLLSLQPMYDKLTMGRIHPVSLWGGLAFFIGFNLWFGFLANTTVWHAFSMWVVS